jgi:hypothetical protein
MPSDKDSKEEPSVLEIIDKVGTKEYVRQLVDERAKNVNQKDFKKTGQYYFEFSKGGLTNKPKKSKKKSIYITTKMRYI